MRKIKEGNAQTNQLSFQIIKHPNYFQAFELILQDNRRSQQAVI